MSQSQEEIWLAETCELIRGSLALQFFFQNFFEQTGIYGVAPREAELLARAAGQRDVALDVKAILDQFDPLLYSELQIARIEYQTQTRSEEEHDDGS